MPRLTHFTYLQQCHELRDSWSGGESNVFFLLNASEQWDLFAYFFPHEAFTDEQLLTAREQITAFYPSLPQRAGRAWMRYQNAVVAYERYQGKLKSQPPRERQKANR